MELQVLAELSRACLALSVFGLKLIYATPIEGWTFLLVGSASQILAASVISVFALNLFATGFSSLTRGLFTWRLEAPRALFGCYTACKKKSKG